MRQRLCLGDYPLFFFFYSRSKFCWKKGFARGHYALSILNSEQIFVRQRLRLFTKICEPTFSDAASRGKASGAKGGAWEKTKKAVSR